MLSILLTGICVYLLSGCLNYREIDRMAIVAGVAIDKAEKDNILVTVEVISVDSGQEQSSMKPIYLQLTGDSFFGAVRKLISVQGKKLYWSHAKVIIISEDIAKEGITRYLDFLNRDAEIREDMWVLLSKEKKAYEVFNARPTTDTIISIEIDNAMRAQASISRYPDVELYQFLDDLADIKAAAILPTVKLIDIMGKPTFMILGAAVFKKDKLQGYLDENEAKILLLIRNELRGGLYFVKNFGKDKETVTLEIFKCKTTLKPEIRGSNILMNIEVYFETSIGGIMGKEDFISEPGRNFLKAEAEKRIKRDIEVLITKAQKELKADMLGYGIQIRRSMPQAWKTIEADWDEFFTDIETNVVVSVGIKGSGISRKPTRAKE